MSKDISLRFYHSNAIGKPGSIEQITALFKKENFQICDVNIHAENGTDFHWDLYEPSEQDVLSLAYQHCGMDFQCSREDEPLELTVYIGWTKTDEVQPGGNTFLAVTTFQTALFTREENNPVYFSNLFLTIGKRLFEVTCPDFGWIDMENFAGFTSDRDIFHGSIPYTYWANFLGEKYIKKYGREKLLHIPVWHSEILKPEGVLLVLSPVLGVHTGETELLKAF